MNYVYDGTFEGLLTAVFDGFYFKEKDLKILIEKNFEYNFLENHREIFSDNQKFSRVYDGIRKKLGLNILTDVYTTFLAGEKDKDTAIYLFLQKAFQIGRAVSNYLADENVAQMYKLCRRVNHEAHTMTGFVRFSLTKSNIYYSAINPKHNITELIAPHFADRFNDQRLIIHDESRNIAALCYKGKWILSEFYIDATPDFSDFSKDEINYQNLWKDFYNTIGIEGRKNPSSVKRHIPKRYRPYLTEFRLGAK